MSDFKSKKELMDYVKASSNNHARYKYDKSIEAWDEFWKDGEMRYVDTGEVAAPIGSYHLYTKLTKLEVDKTKEKAKVKELMEGKGK